MSNYLLPCSCGQKLSVSPSQAGQSVQCVCGARLEVPALRGLRELPRADTPGATMQAKAWENRQRAVFSLALVAIGAFALGGYLAVHLPPASIYPTPEDIETSYERGSVGEIYASYQEFQQGIGPETVVNPFDNKRTLMLGGVNVAVGLGFCAVVATLFAFFGGRRQASSVARR